MIRVIGTELLLFLIPFALYAGYVWLQRRREALGEERAVPWTWLAIAGLSLALVGFGSLAMIGGAPPDADYVPPHMENGRLVPGHFEPGHGEAKDNARP